MKNILVIFLACIALALNAQDAAQSLKQAEALYLEGLQADKDNDRAKAADTWNKAAQLYTECLEKPEFDNARLRYNLGNVYFMQKKLGQAIHQYTRAQALEPDNADIAANLALARSQRRDKLAAEDKDQVLKTLFAFHYDLPLTTRRIAFHASYILLFLAVILRILTRPHAAYTSVIAIAAVTAAVLAISIAITWRQEECRRGVIVATAVHAKAGSSAIYPNAFQAPLHDGAEFRVLNTDESGKWLHVTLENNADCWLPASAVILQD